MTLTRESAFTRCEVCLSVYHGTAWCHEVQTSPIEAAARAESLPTVEALHEALSSDPRGCEHPKAMSPQCERIARALGNPGSGKGDDPFEGAVLVLP